MWSTYLLGGWIVSTAVFWIAAYLFSALQLARLQPLDGADRQHPPAWPTVSVLVPARNEADSLEAALETLRNQDYPDLEIVVIDDRSTDTTGAIADRMAREDDRIRAVHVEELPEGWLGKVHALHRGEREATGEWLLLTDADVEHAPDVVRRTVEIAHAADADHVACVPRMRSRSVLFQICYAAFFLGAISFAPIRRIEDPEAEGYMGVGAFNLVRRSTLRAAGGFEPLRMEVADDLGVGYLVSQQNGRTRMLRASSALEVEWYDSLAATVEGFEKNAFAAFGHYTYWRIVAFSLLWVVVGTGPIVGLTSGVGPLQIAGAIPLLGSALYGAVAARVLDQPVGPFLGLYLGHWLLFYVVLNSTYKCWRRGGIVWRETEYPLEELREHQRVQL